MSFVSRSRAMSTFTPRLEKVAANKLFVSEPNPIWFGNPMNKPTKHWTNDNWLKSRFHFAFAEYRDPSNSHFGVLRVMNDDLVQPQRGFGEHPHSDMEIVTYVVDGNLTHQDSTGNKESLPPGSVQFMTAGKGLYHSESNDHETEPCRFIQMWIVPRTRGLDVNYGSLLGDEKSVEKRKNKWFHMVSDVNNPVATPIKVNQDANIFVTEISPATPINFELKAGRQAYLLMIKSEGASVTTESLKFPSDGEITSSMSKTEVLKSHDAAKLYGPAHLSINSATGAHVLIVEMKED